MPYNDVNDLPDSVKKHLPEHAQKIYMAAFNNAWKEYDKPQERRGNESREEVSRKVAWAAVKHEYQKDEKSGDWKPKQGD